MFNHNALMYTQNGKISLPSRCPPRPNRALHLRSPSLNQRLTPPSYLPFVSRFFLTARAATVSGRLNTPHPTTARAFLFSTVVALFNAISKRQNQGDGSAGAGAGAVAGTARASAAKGASRHAFLDMLKTGVKPNGEAGAAAGAAGGKRAGGSAQGGAGAGAAAGGGAEVRAPPT